MGGCFTCALSARRKSDRGVKERESEKRVGRLHKPSSPRVDARGANHGIKARLEQRDLTQVCHPRWDGLEYVAHRVCRGTRGCQHESQSAKCQLARSGGEGGTHRGRRLRTRPSRRACRLRVYREGRRVPTRARCSAGWNGMEWSGASWTGL
jgi:hypothetical protein